MELQENQEGKGPKGRAYSGSEGTGRAWSPPRLGNYSPFPKGFLGTQCTSGTVLSILHLLPHFKLSTNGEIVLWEVFWDCLLTHFWQVEPHHCTSCISTNLILLSERTPFFCYFVIFVIFKIVSLRSCGWLFGKSLCGPGCPQTHRDWPSGS